MAYTVIDVSKFNTITNHAAAASLVDGVIIRAGYRGYGSSGTLIKDSNFETNYNGFVGRTKVGIYWVTQAITTAEAIAEANYVYGLISSKQIDFPIYLDIEYANSSHTGRADSLSKAVRTANALAFCNRMNELGYRAGTYTSDSWYSTSVDPAQLQAAGHSIWVAKYSSSAPKYVSDYDGWQYSSSASISGISGNCDISRFYHDVAGWETSRPDINNYALVVPTVDFTYSGGAIEPSFYLRGLNAWSDYTYSYSNNINAGVGTCTITGINNYQGTRTFNFNINPYPINGYTLELNGYSFTYNRFPVTPSGYIPGLDSSNYTITYSNNVNAGAATATATGIGNYGGSTSRIFTIEKKSLIGNYSIRTEHESYEYTGSEIKAKLIVGDLTEGTEFVTTYDNNVNVGIATAIATGIGNFANSISTNFRIARAAIDITTQPVTMSYTTTVYNRLPQCPDITVGDLTEGVDYTLELLNNVNVGTATVNIIGINDYTGTITKTFTITKRNISEYEIKIPATTYEYTRNTIKPKVTLGELVENVDFTVQYTNNIYVGTAGITVTGKDNYYGVLSTTFTITQADIANIDASLSENTYIYDGQYKTPYVIISELVQDVDYTLKYSDNVNAGTASVVISGIGNYKGFKQLTYTIIPQSIYDRTLIVEGDTFYYNIIAIEPKAYINNLRLNDDYVITYSDNVAVGTGKVIATGVNNYQGTITVPFTILTKKIEDCTAKYGWASVKTIYRIKDDLGLRVYTDSTEKVQLREYFDYEITDTKEEDKDDFLLVTFHVKGYGGFSDEANYRFRIIAAEPSTPIDYEDDGVYNFGDIDTGDETAYGNYDFKELEDPVDLVSSSSSILALDLEDIDDNISDTDENTKVAILSAVAKYRKDHEQPEPVVPDRVEDGDDFDFDEMSGMYLDKFDEDDGSNIDDKGNDKKDPSIIVDDDDGTYNFGSLDLQDETAEGDYDFGDLDEGVDEDSVAKGDYDFNKLAGDIEEWLAEGTEFDLKNTPIYATYDAPTSFDTRTGAYFIYNSAVVNGRIRMARTDAAVAMPGRSAGWCKTYDLLNLGAIVVGDQVKVDGKIYVYANGSGGSINTHPDIMYVKEIVDATQYDYPYALASGPRSARIGFASKEMLTKVEL